MTFPEKHAKLTGRRKMI